MIEAIFNYFKIDNRIGTAGQPKIDQFAAIADAGYQAVINLALPTSDNAIPNEGSIVSSFGMTYVHLPVDFEKPKVTDFETFSAIMNSLGDQKVFVHCAMNMRVSAFVYMYRVRHLNVSRKSAAEQLHQLWHPDQTWQRLIDEVLGKTE